MLRQKRKKIREVKAKKKKDMMVKTKRKTIRHVKAKKKKDKGG